MPNEQNADQASKVNRAYSILEVKAIQDGEDFVTVEGIASTPTADRMGDVVEPLGAQFKTPMPLLWQHEHDKPVGQVTFAKPTKTGIPFKAQIPVIKEAGTLKDRVDEAIQSIKYKLVAAVSIGFRALQDGVEVMKDGGYLFKNWEWLELSLVTIPANSEAVITAVKSIDQKYLSAIGQKDTAVESDPGVSGAQTKSVAKRGPVKLIKRNPK